MNAVEFGPTTCIQRRISFIDQHQIIRVFSHEGTGYCNALPLFISSSSPRALDWETPDLSPGLQITWPCRCPYRPLNALEIRRWNVSRWAEELQMRRAAVDDCSAANDSCASLRPFRRLPIWCQGHSENPRRIFLPRRRRLRPKVVVLLGLQCQPPNPEQRHRQHQYFLAHSLARICKTTEIWRMCGSVNLLHPFDGRQCCLSRKFRMRNRPGVPRRLEVSIFLIR